MMELKSKYITSEDFKQMFGIDLNSSLNADDNPSNMVNAFLFRIEDVIASKVKSTNGNSIDIIYIDLSDYQKQEYKLALLYQAYYEFKNGELWNDSGYDMESSVIANRNYIKEISISQMALQHLTNAGLLCRKINTNRGVLHEFWR